MTTSTAPTAGQPAPSAARSPDGRPARPPLARPASGRLLAGVVAGTAAHLRLDPLVVRVVVVGLAFTGVGVVAYALLWLTMPVADPSGDSTPTAVIGQRPSRRQLILLALLSFVVFGLVSQLLTFGGYDVVLPLVLAGIGLAVIWRQTDSDASLSRRTSRWGLAAGVVVGVVGVVLLLATTGQLANARNGFTATVVILVGVALATAPLWRRLLDQRATERAARIRSEERAAVAAHLHDSVLQTLALIQRHAADPTVVGRLARSQERELRAWLYEPTVATGGTWAGLVARLVAEVEADHAVTVDPVVVGDLPVDDAVATLGQAAREAVVNAAKHSGAPSVSLYSEVTPGSVTVFVRDRGTGFDPTAVPGDRRGLRDSVVGRLTRLGGTATVRSAPGEGTEVELCLPRERTEATA
ncbi:ATP-binding protein [Modestobacter marinus]|uniref:Histidine kinase n=1 Tax=Modestobacter marinus TaxID=477641 RepID=A0A846LQ43_9ACTN|nr:ATP-binding protein [Modestobacter marinus]NIH67595.1 signal transduction histidine kinase [Modestobacter marinus]GGL72854.1 histidine kinase [Modestobacter marinus]